MPSPANLDRPEYARIVHAAKVAAIQSLSPELRRARDAALRETTEITKAKRKARVNQAARINDLLDSGWTPAEVADKVGLSEHALIRRRHRWGHPIFRRFGFRWLRCWIRDEHFDALDLLARRHRVTRATVLERIMEASLADGGLTASWLLSKDAAKKRAA